MWTCLEFFGEFVISFSFLSYVLLLYVLWNEDYLNSFKMFNNIELVFDSYSWVGNYLFLDTWEKSLKFSLI